MPVIAGQKPVAGEPVESLATRTARLRKSDGFLPLYWEEHAGKMNLEIDHLNEEFLYLAALSAGVGSNNLGLDRGRMDQPKGCLGERACEADCLLH
jgi:hypothetical protein